MRFPGRHLLPVVENTRRFYTGIPGVCLLTLYLSLTFVWTVFPAGVTAGTHIILRLFVIVDSNILSV